MDWARAESHGTWLSRRASPSTMREYWDFTLFFFASLPILYRAYELSTLSAIVDTKHLLSPLWWLAILGVSLLYFLHAFIWNYPKRFTALSKSCRCACSARTPSTSSPTPRSSANSGR